MPTPLSIRTRLEYDVTGTVDVLLQIEAAERRDQRVAASRLALPEHEHFARVAGQGGIGERVWLRTAGPLVVDYEARVEAQRSLADIEPLRAVPPHLLPSDTVDYLMPSRYCTSDSFQAFVESEFAGLEGGARVLALRDWIERTLSYEPGSSDAFTTAADTFRSRRGVCRDYAHLMIALARASAIPARFASVYGLGVDPQDFHAVAEVFLDGAWHLVDTTGMTTPDRIALIGVGRDAADASFLTSFGEIALVSQSVDVSPAEGP